MLARGCLACHQFGPLGESGLFGGGELAGIAYWKRPAGFLTRWLQDPAAINRSHRMPIFSFTSDDLESIRLWEENQLRLVSPQALISHSQEQRRSLIQQGEQLVQQFRCTNCHLAARDADELAKPTQRPLTAQSNWADSCLDEPVIARKQPGYRLLEADRAALREFYSQPRPGEGASRRGRSKARVEQYARDLQADGQRRDH